WSSDVCSSDLRKKPLNIKGLIQNLADRGAFEPPIRYSRIHAFQACAFNHSATCPDTHKKCRPEAGNSLSAKSAIIARHDTPTRWPCLKPPAADEHPANARSTGRSCPLRY